MHEGEPGDRSFDPAMAAHPLGWLRERLEQVDTLVPGVDAEDVVAVRALAPAVLAAAEEGLAWAREPWPVVDHDERGMAVG